MRRVTADFITACYPANFSGAYFNIVPYGVNEEGVINYEEVRKKRCGDQEAA